MCLVEKTSRLPIIIQLPKGGCGTVQEEHTDMASESKAPVDEVPAQICSGSISVVTEPTACESPTSYSSSGRDSTIPREVTGAAENTSDGHFGQLKLTDSSDDSADESCTETKLEEKRRALASLRLDIQKRLGTISSFCETPPERPNPTEGTLVYQPVHKCKDKSGVHAPFVSKFQPHEMRCLALVAHDHMIPSMMQFVESHKELLKKFRLMCTSGTLEIVNAVYDGDPSVAFGPVCTASDDFTSDAQLATQLCLGDVGGIIFFMDPLSSTQSQTDVEAIMKISNVHNILVLSNPSSATAMAHMLRLALVEGRSDMIPSFFSTCQSPSVKEYKKRQKEKKGGRHKITNAMIDVALMMRLYSPKS